MEIKWGPFARNEDGATAIEYGLIAAILALGIVPGLSLLAPALNALFTSLLAYF